MFTGGWRFFPVVTEIFQTVRNLLISNRKVLSQAFIKSRILRRGGK